MEKHRTEVLTPPALSPTLSLAFCAVCGLVCSSQIPLFALENPVQLLPPAAIRPAVFAKTTTTKSPAKSQVSKARISPSETLKPATSSKATRFALTRIRPKAIKLPLLEQPESVIDDNVKPDTGANTLDSQTESENVVALAIANPAIQNTAAKERDVAVVSTIAAEENQEAVPTESEREAISPNGSI